MDALDRYLHADRARQARLAAPLYPGLTEEEVREALFPPSGRVDVSARHVDQPEAGEDH